MTRLHFIYAFLLLISCSCRVDEGPRQEASGSMEPSIKKGEFIFLTPLDKPPSRWDVVSFESPVNGNMWVQRVVGLPGEVIDIHDSSVYINGVRQTAPSKMKGIWYSKEGKVTFPFTIPKNSFFVLGDNTTDAQDSRYIGSIPAKSIVSKVENK